MQISVSTREVLLALALLIHLYIVCGYVLTTVGVEYLGQRPHGLQSPKYLLSDPLKKTFANHD